MSQELIKFNELSQREKESLYAYCWGNPMLIAEYLNGKNKVRNGEEGFVCFQDIQDMLDEMSNSDRGKLESAKEIAIDKKMWETFGDGNANYVKNIAEKFHPKLKNENSLGGGMPILRIEHIIKAAELSGEDPKQIMEGIDYEVIDESED